MELADFQKEKSWTLILTTSFCHLYGFWYLTLALSSSPGHFYGHFYADYPSGLCSLEFFLNLLMSWCPHLQSDDTHTSFTGLWSSNERAHTTV